MGAATNTFSHSRLDPAFGSERASILRVALTDGTYARGTVLGIVTATSKHRAYASANADGSQNACAFLQYPCTVLAGKVTIEGDGSPTLSTAPVYTNGHFRTNDLVGLDANALVNLNATIVKGTLALGIVRIG